MAIDFDADVGGLGLPVEFCVGDIEEVTGADDFFGGDGHEADFGGVGFNLGGPEAEELFVGFDAFAGWGCWRPFEVYYALYGYLWAVSVTRRILRGGSVLTCFLSMSFIDGSS